MIHRPLMPKCRQDPGNWKINNYGHFVDARGETGGVVVSRFKAFAFMLCLVGI